eukprot:6058068-Amphidinium_carterae.1
MDPSAQPSVRYQEATIIAFIIVLLRQVPASLLRLYRSAGVKSTITRQSLWCAVLVREPCQSVPLEVQGFLAHAQLQSMRADSAVDELLDEVARGCCCIAPGESGLP